MTLPIPQGIEILPKALNHKQIFCPICQKSCEQYLDKEQYSCVIWNGNDQDHSYDYLMRSYHSHPCETITFAKYKINFRENKLSIYQRTLSVTDKLPIVTSHLNKMPTFKNEKDVENYLLLS